MNASAMTVYGSNLWNLFSKDCDRLYTSYNVAVRNILKIDRCTHRFLLEPLSEALHLKTMLLSKFVSFHRTLVTSSKFPVRFLARLLETDLRSVHGQNLCNIAQLCEVDWPLNLEDLTSKLVKRKICYKAVPGGHEWKLGICKDLLEIRDNEDVQLPGFSLAEIEELLSFICVS